MGLFNFFSSKKELPKVKGFTYGISTAINYDLSIDVFYKFYEFNGFIAAAINKRMRDVGAHGFEIRKGDKAISMDEFKKLISVGVPYTPKSFIARLVRDYEVSANAYIYLQLDGTQVKGIQILDPRFVKPITNPQGQVLGYVQNLDGIRAFTKDEILHLRDGNNLKNENVGKSKMTSLFLDLETDQEAKESNLAFFKNNQTPASLILIDPAFEIAEGKDQEYDRKLKEIFEGGKYVGGKNKHRSAMLEGIKDIIKVQDKISDMEFIELRKFTRAMVGAVYEVSDDVLGYTENSNRSTGLVQSFNYYSSIFAENEVFSEFLTTLMQRIDPSWSFVILQDQLTLLMMKAEIAGSLYYDKRLITLNEGRDLIQYEKTKDGDKFFEGETKSKETDLSKKVSGG